MMVMVVILALVSMVLVRSQPIGNMMYIVGVGCY